MVSYGRQQRKEDVLLDQITSLGAHWNSIQRYLICHEGALEPADDTRRALVRPQLASHAAALRMGVDCQHPARVEFYDLADAGYDARVIKGVSRQLGHEPIIDRNARRGEKNVEDPGAKFVNIVPADKVRYNHRMGVERVFSHLHGAHGGKFVRVRGAKKVFLHLMFGLLVIMAEQILNLTT